MTLQENGSLNGWHWQVRIWIGAGGEPFCAEECLDQFQNIILLSCNNPSLQIYLLCEIWRKCYQTCSSTYGLFSAVLMRNDLHVADRSYSPWNEAYNHSLPLSSHSLPLTSHLLSMPCWEGKADGQIFFANFFHKQGFS